MTIKVNKKRLEKFEKNLKGAQRSGGIDLEVGIIDGGAAAVYSSGQSVGEVALIHETGSGVPRRSWLKDWVLPNSKKTVTLINDKMGNVLKLRSNSLIELGKIGAWAAGQIQQRISRGEVTASPPSGVDDQPGKTPLIDTARLRTAITWRIK